MPAAETPAACGGCELDNLNRGRRPPVNGSGGRRPYLANLCGLPACALPLPAIKIIPHIFRVMGGRGCRPSVFQAGHIPSWHGSCECYALSPVAAAGRWSLLLLSSLLSAAVDAARGAARTESGQQVFDPG